MKKTILGAACVLLLIAFYPATAAVAPTVPHETPVKQVIPEPVVKPVKRHASEPTEVPYATSTPLNASQVAIRAQVEAAFPDVPEMVSIVRCESHYRQFAGAGSSTPLISPTDDVGVAQINIPTWSKEAAARHLDIYHSVPDNLAMARIVYEKQGLAAWTCKAS